MFSLYVSKLYTNKSIQKPNWLIINIIEIITIILHSQFYEMKMHRRNHICLGGYCIVILSYAAYLYIFNKHTTGIM